MHVFVQIVALPELNPFKEMQIEWKKLNAGKTGITLLKEEADLKKAGGGV